MGTLIGPGRDDIKIQNLFSDPCFRTNGFTRAPALVQWMATQRCSLSCPHCLSGSAGPEGELGLDEVRGLLDQVADLGVYEFLVTGGEPLTRPDLPEVIRLMGERKIRWSLNTAVCPGPEVKKAVEVWPPAFVAVSVDGPRPFHDAFRGRKGSFNRAMEAVSYFNRVASGGVACGTTVTRKNLHLLDETLRIVMGSGAAQWGLHLVFPEGNAENRPELMLSKKQLKKLIQFTADRRSHFPVTLGDELGYCGEWEPLLRDEPFFCAAGRAQCVVLPDGHVVPCTTFDTSTSAGNIRTQPLLEIWRNGFTALRTESLTEKCEACAYAPACGGGCWLQRRHGVHCFREVWSKPGFMKKAAGIAVCLGLAACSGPAEQRAGAGPASAPRPPAAAPAAAPAATAARTPGKARAEGPKTARVVVKGAPILINGVDALEQYIMQWYRANAGRFPGPAVAAVRKQIQTLLSGDPAGKYLTAVINGKFPKRLADRAARIKKALKTTQRSLSLSSLLLRDLAEWCLDGSKPQKRTAAERRLLRETLKTMAVTTGKWRKEVLDKKLEPFLRRGPGRWRPFVMTKAGFPRFRDRIMHQLAFKRWGPFRGFGSISAAYLKTHPYALSMRLPFRVTAGSGLKRITPAGRKAVTARGHMDVFDVLKVPTARGRRTRFRIEFGSGTRKVSVKLPPGTELTWADVIRLAYEQNTAVLQTLAKGRPGRLLPRPLMLPVFRAHLAKLTTAGQSSMQLLRTRWLVMSMWMF